MNNNPSIGPKTGNCYMNFLICMFPTIVCQTGSEIVQNMSGMVPRGRQTLLGHLCCQNICFETTHVTKQCRTIMTCRRAIKPLFVIVLKMIKAKTCVQRQLLNSDGADSSPSLILTSFGTKMSNGKSPKKSPVIID